MKSNELNEKETSSKKAYVRPQLTKQGKVEEMTQDHLQQDCTSSPVR